MNVETNFQKKHLIVLEHSGFPYGFASMEKLKLISKALLHEKYKVLIINRKPALDCSKGMLPAEGTIEGIDYIYTARPYCNNLKIFRKIVSGIIGLFQEFLLMIRLKTQKKLDFAYISYTKIPFLIYYRLLSIIFRFKLIMSIAELHIAIDESSIVKKLNNRFYDRFSFGLSDGVIVISDLLKERVRKFYPNKPIIKVPALCDYSIFEKELLPASKLDQEYILFCGAAGYYEVIDFIIQSYEVAIINEKILLYLIVNGKPEQMQKVKQRIKNSKKTESIKLFQKLEYKELVKIYKAALCLLIPLRDTNQDRARFPHKIGEYLAAKRPIITTNIGEVKNYFTDMENALVCNNFDIVEYGSKIEYVINNSETANLIGQKGYETGIKKFDYKLFSKPLTDFINRL